MVSLDWEGTTSWSTSQTRHLCLEFHNVGGWLTHGDLALAAGVDFLAVAEHRLIPARVRSEWSRLKGKGISSVWAPASQASSHVGNAGVGVVSLRGVHLLCLLLILLSLSLSLTAGVLCGVCSLLPLVGFCTCLFFMVIRVLILMPSSLL